MDAYLSEKIKELWNIEWEIRAMVMLSLSLQIVLVFFANRQKYTTGKWLRKFVWLAYVSADWVALTALGILARSQRDPETNSANRNLIPAFWAPILLVHLGGPDTITAYQMEDNELWLRHLLTLAAQISLTIYFLFVSWKKDSLTFIAIVVLVSGTIKYGERVWAFWHASSKKFRDSATREIESSYRLFHSQFKSCGENLFNLSNASIDAELDRIVTDVFLSSNAIVPEEAKYHHLAQFLFPMLKILFADLPLIFPQHVASYKMLKTKDAFEAFKLIEIELGYMHDMLYTKVTRASLPGIILRFITLLSSIFAFAAFTTTMNKHHYSKIDTIISLLLLVGAIFFEIYSLIIFLFSDLVVLWLTKTNLTLSLATNSLFRAIHPSRLMLFPCCTDKRWSSSMAQRNLLDDLCISVKKLSGGFEYLVHRLKAEFWFYWANDETWEDVDVHLKQLIFGQLLEKRSRYDPAGGHDFTAFLEKLLAERGDGVLRRMQCIHCAHQTRKRKRQCLDDLVWSIVGIGFDQSLILWHVATDLCYYDDELKKVGRFNNLPSNRTISRLLSGYMLYLMLSCSSMMPKGFGETRYVQTIMGARILFKRGGRRHNLGGSKNASNELFEKYRSGMMSMDLDVPGDIKDCCKLAESLQSLETEHGWTNDDKWDMISKVWVEMLTHAASHCGWKEHAQRLNQGGELLTHVCLLMAHLGLNEQCRKEAFFYPVVDFLSSQFMIVSSP